MCVGFLQCVCACYVMFFVHQLPQKIHTRTQLVYLNIIILLFCSINFVVEIFSPADVSVSVGVGWCWCHNYTLKAKQKSEVGGEGGEKHALKL